MTFRLRINSVIAKIMSSFVMLSLSGLHSAQAGSFNITDSLEAEYKVSLNYTAAIRMREPAEGLINGPIVPFQLHTKPLSFGGFGFADTQNYDDGDRNFKKYSLINNQISTFAEFNLKSEHYGAVFSGSAFYDNVYAKGDNDNTSATTVNSYGANGELPSTNRTNTNKFRDGTVKALGKKARLLDAYVYGNFNIGSMPFDLRVGQQVAAYGESLVFSGISSAQGPFDAGKAFIAGAEVKDIILPVKQVAMRLGVNEKLSLMGEYQLDFEPTIAPAAGSYFSPADVVGPGGEFVYGSLNPLGGLGCEGLLQFGNVNLDSLCSGGLFNFLGKTLNSNQFILTTRDPDILPSKYGHYGIAARYAITPSTTIGLYRLRYADHNPAIEMKMGYASFGTLGKINFSTKMLNQVVPVSYAVKYFDGINLTAASFSTTVAGISIAGELDYRQKVPIGMSAIISDAPSPVFTLGDTTTLIVNGIYTMPVPYFDSLTLVGEVGAIHVNNTTPIPATDGIIAVGDGNQLFYNKTSWAFDTREMLTKRNIFNGWDLTIPFGTSMIVSGNPSSAGAFASLYGEGDLRANVGLVFEYLQNFNFGLNYNKYYGNPNKNIGDSPLRANPYADRDYATFNVKYNF